MNLVEQVLEAAVQIQQIPAPTFAEAQRALFIQQRFEAEGLRDVCTDDAGNVYGRLPGAGSAPPLVVSAHLDTVFPANTDLTLHRESDRIWGPGIGDNSLGVAGLFGLLWFRRQQPQLLAGDLWLVANVGEEGLGDLCGMRAVVDRFQGSVLAYIILEGMALGQVYQRALGVKRFRIKVHTVGGHSWVDYGTPSAVHELAMLVTRITELQLPKTPRTTLNVGVISGGTSINTIAASAEMELDLRSEDPDVLRILAAQVQMLVGRANRPGVTVTVERIGERPPGSIPQNHPLVRLAVRSLELQRIQAVINIGSTDANIPLSRGYPAICIGLSTGSGAHTVDEFIYTRPLEQGLAQLNHLVGNAFAQGS